MGRRKQVERDEQVPNLGPVRRRKYDPCGGRPEPWSVAMAEEPLVESLVADSVKLLQELDGQGDMPSNVLWYYFSDAEEWRLLVAGKPFDQLLPKDEGQAYQRRSEEHTSELQS